MGSPRHRLRHGLLAIAFCCLGHPALARVTIDIHATPDNVPADGISQITVTATVRDGDQPAERGSVVFTVNAGGLIEMGGGGVPSLTLVVPIENGTARCLLVASNFPTDVQILATTAGLSEQTAGRAMVYIGDRADEERTADSLIRVSGDMIAYAPETDIQVMEVFGNARLTYRGVVICANYLQIDLQNYSMLARDTANGVTIGRGEPPYDAADLADATKPPYEGVALGLSLLDMYGAIYSPQRGETVVFSGFSLTPQPDVQISPEQLGEMFDPYDLSEIEIWVNAKRATIYPHEKILFERAKFQVQGVTVYSQPYYFEYLGYEGSQGPAITQIVNYSTRDGWIIDLPYYFDVGDRHTNEFRLTRGISTGLFGRNQGFQLSFNHHADLPNDRGQFDFTIDEIGKNFGVRYNLQQRLGTSTFGSLSLAWPQHRNVYGSATLYSPVGAGNMSATVNVDYLTGFASGLSSNVNLVWQSTPRPLFGGVRMSTSVGGSYSRGVIGSERWRQSLSMSFTQRPWNVFGQTGRISPYLGLRLNNTLDGPREAAVTFNTTWHQQLGPYMSTSLGYTFDKVWSSAYSIPDRHLLTLNWMLTQQDRWNGYAFANYNLADATLSTSVLLEHMLSRHWGVLGSTVYQSSRAGSFGESEIWLFRLIGQRELRLRYSVETGRLFFEIDNRY